MSSDTPQQGPWTILKLLTWTEEYFVKFEIDSPRLTAEILLSHALGIRRLDLYLQFDRPLNRDELGNYKQLIRRRVHDREPVAYITGGKGFWDADFSVSPHVLIPRPDTETLVEQAVALINASDGEGDRKKILDLGTGSGAVILSIARECPGHTFFASDLSIAAVKTARENVQANQLAAQPGVPLVHFLAASWLDPLSSGIRFDVIVSNPPYIPSADILSLQPEIRDHEPWMALDGGSDGFDCFRQILVAAANHLTPGGLLLMEMGFDQREQMKAESSRHPQYHEPRFVKDYAGHDRVVILTRKRRG